MGKGMLRNISGFGMLLPGASTCATSLRSTKSTMTEMTMLAKLSA
jgi:hypothetical protein